MLEGIQNGTNTMKKRLAISYTTKHTSTLWPSNFIPYCLSERNENKVVNCFIHNS